MSAHKVLVITFVNIVRNAGGPASAAVGIAESLHAQGRLQGLVCPAFEPEAVRIPKHLLHSPPSPLLQRVIGRVLALAHRLLGINERRMREGIFDWFLSRSRTLKASDAVLFLKPAFPRTVQRASRLQIPTFVWASILHPRFNQKAVLDERQVWQLGGGDAYTDEERIERLSRFFRTVDHILVGSELAQRSFVSHRSDREAPILLQGTFTVDCERFHPAASDEPQPRPFRVLHASHMNLIKGIGYLLDAWTGLDLADAELVLAGPVEPELDPILQRFPSPSVRLPGFVRDTPELFRSCDLFVSPSVADLHPYTVLEAIASGLPVLVSDRCGLSTLIEDGVQGFVYPHNNADALAAHIRWCRDNPERTRQMGHEARTTALGCNRDSFFQSVIGAMDEKLERYRSH